MRSPKNSELKFRAYAKLNLTLKITGKRADGYHHIDSIMQSISLHDEVDIKAANSGIKVKCPSINEKDNIAYKAAELFLKEAKISSGVDISIRKNIPLSSGLGGGSADAAATLIGMNKLFEANLHKDKLLEIAARIGSDVPFCLVGGTARCTGIGEKIDHVNSRAGAAFMLVIPKLEVPTKMVYSQYDKVGGSGENELEKAAQDLFPDIAVVKDELIKRTGQKWQMSGSGPALYIELMDLSEAEKYLDAVGSLGAIHHVVMRMDSGVELISGLG